MVLAAGCMKTATGTIGAADSQTAGNSLAAEIEAGATSFGPVATSGAANGSCVTLSGDTSDADGDSIPAMATLTFDCIASQNGYTGSLTGTENVTDTQPNMGTWNFTANADLHMELIGPNGGSLTNDRTGTITGTESGIMFGLERSLASTTTLAAPGGASISMEESHAWTVTYTPTTDWMAGAVVVGGTLSATGTWDVTIGNNTAAATLDTPAPLTVSAGCPTRLTAGSLTASYEGGGHMNTITIAWTGCGTHTVTYAAK